MIGRMWWTLCLWGPLLYDRENVVDRDLDYYTVDGRLCSCSK